jgi:hypothetical protein
MLIEYTRDLQGNYMTIEREMENGDFQTKMLCENEIAGLLKVFIKKFDFSYIYCYDITSKQTIQKIYEKKKIQSADIKKLFSSIEKTMKAIELYLLNSKNLMLEPEYIYTDIEGGSYYFFIEFFH